MKGERQFNGKKLNPTGRPKYKKTDADTSLAVDVGLTFLHPSE